MDGFIKVYRTILENPVVCKDSDHLAVWIYLLLNATHKNLFAMFNGKKITLKPGQLITGRQPIVKVFNLSDSKVQRILKTFESEQQIEQQTCGKGRLITLLNWNEYQHSEQQSEQPLNSHRTATEQPLNTNKKDKNERMKEKRTVLAQKRDEDAEKIEQLKAELRR